MTLSARFRPATDLHLAAEREQADAHDQGSELCRLDQASAPSLPELLLALPQDDEPFERIGLTPREFPCT